MRYPDRELPAKPLQAERINPFFQWRLCAATGTIFASARPEATGKTIASGTDKSVPYMVRCKTQHRTCVTRNVTVSSIVPNRATRDKCIRSCAKAPLKKCEANTVLSAPSNRVTSKLSTALMYGGSFTVLSVASTPGNKAFFALI